VIENQGQLEEEEVFLKKIINFEKERLRLKNLKFDLVGIRSDYFQY